MLIAVDFEAIASRTTSPGLAWMLNDAFDLNIPETQLEELSTLEDLEKMPAARMLFEQAEKNVALSRKLESVIEAAWENQQSALLHQRALPMRHAATSLSLLAQQHELLYLTWRVPQSQHITSEWLRLHAFPSPERVIICQEPLAPFQATLDTPRSGNIVLITPQVEAMIDAFLLLPPKQRERLFLVALRRAESFKVEVLAPSFTVFALPSWVKEHVMDLFAEIDGYQHFQRWLRTG